MRFMTFILEHVGEWQMRRLRWIVSEATSAALKLWLAYCGTLFKTHVKIFVFKKIDVSGSVIKYFLFSVVNPEVVFSRINFMFHQSVFPQDDLAADQVEHLLFGISDFSYAIYLLCTFVLPEDLYLHLEVCLFWALSH